MFSENCSWQQPFFATATPVITRAQDVAPSSPSDSVADAARKARAQKKDAVKPVRSSPMTMWET